MQAERVTAERERLGMKQAELSREIGVSKQMINAIEKGLRDPSEKILVRMAKIFGCTTDYLLGLSDKR